MKLSFSMASVTLILITTLLASGCQSPSVDKRQVPLPSVTLAAPCRDWAVRIEKPGLPNLHRVSDDLYRGAQPTAEGFRQLKAMGVKTVINLRPFYQDREKIAGTGLDYEEIPMIPWHAEDEDVVRFLKLVADRIRAPFFVHCYHGADRTGMMCAVYRIVVQGWTKDEAIAEMTHGGFGFYVIWGNLVDYLRKLDVEKLKREAFHSRVQEMFIFGHAQAYHALELLAAMGAHVPNRAEQSIRYYGFCSKCSSGRHLKQATDSVIPYVASPNIARISSTSQYVGTFLC